MKYSKKTQLTAVALAAGLLILCAGCSNLIGDSDAPALGFLRVSFNPPKARTIESGIDLVVVKYVVTLSYPADSSVADVSFDLAAGTTTSSDQTLAVGTWNVTVDSVNTSNQIVDSGSSTIEITEGQTSSCTVNLSAANGTGGASLTMSWPAMAANASVSLDIVDMSGTSTNQSAYITYSGVPVIKSVWSRNDLAAGFYRLSFKLFSGSEKVYSTTKLLRIAANQTTTAAFALSAAVELKHLAPPSMVSVAGGTFSHGAMDVTVSDFSIGRYEITQAQWIAVMGSNPSFFVPYADAPARPVEKVNWYGALAYCNKLSIQQGYTPVYTINNSTDPDLWDGTDDDAINIPASVDATWDAAEMDLDATGYRLPTEAEWQWAAMGGNASLGYAYSGSDTLGNVAWIVENADSLTHHVGTKAANELGLYDMNGNVWEWCWDWYESSPAWSDSNPTGPASGSTRLVSGSSFDDTSGLFRFGIEPSLAYLDLGFRVVRRAQ